MGTHTDTSTESLLNKEQMQFFQALVGQILPQIGRGGDVYGGPIAPDASPLQQQGFDQIANMFGGQSGAALERLLSGQPAFQIDPAARDKLYGTEQASQMAQLDETWKMLEERANFAGGSGRSGGLNRSMTQATGDMQLGLGRFYGGLSYQDEQAQRQAQESAANRQIAGLQSQDQMIGMQLRGGDVQRNIQGQQYAEAYNKYLSGRPENNPWLGYTPQVLGTQTKTPVTETWGWGP